MKANIRFDHQLLAVESEHHVHAMLELVAPAGATSSMPTAAEAPTVTVSDPLIEAEATSVAVTVCEPAVPRVTANVFTPLSDGTKV